MPSANKRAAWISSRYIRNPAVWGLAAAFLLGPGTDREGRSVKDAAAKLYALGAILGLYLLECYTALAHIASLGAEIIHRL